MPTTLTILGMSQIYFKGIAMPKSTKKEMASSVLIILKVLTDVSTDFQFYAKIKQLISILNFKTNYCTVYSGHGNGSFKVG